MTGWLAGTGRLRMKVNYPNTMDAPDARIRWSLTVLTMACVCPAFGVVAVLGVFPVLSGGGWFWIGLLFGGATASVLDRVRPPCETATGRWKSSYQFLLKQMPPPD